MAFQVEDGTGLADATAYMSVADFKEYHDDRGGDYSDHDDPAIQVGIVQATDYVDKRFGRRYRGCRSTQAQALEWPRVDAYNDEDQAFDDVPRPLTKAIAEYAMIVLQMDRNLAPIPTPGFSITDPDTGESSGEGSGQIIEKSEEVGPIKETTKWASGNSSGKPMVGTGNLSQSIPEYPQADLWIEEIIDSYVSRDVSRG